EAHRRGRAAGPRHHDPRQLDRGHQPAAGDQRLRGPGGAGGDPAVEPGRQATKVFPHDHHRADRRPGRDARLLARGYRVADSPRLRAGGGGGEMNTPQDRWPGDDIAPTPEEEAQEVRDALLARGLKLVASHRRGYELAAATYRKDNPDEAEICDGIAAAYKAVSAAAQAYPILHA